MYHDITMWTCILGDFLAHSILVSQCRYRANTLAAPRNTVFDTRSSRPDSLHRPESEIDVNDFNNEVYTVNIQKIPRPPPTWSYSAAQSVMDDCLFKDDEWSFSYLWSVCLLRHTCTQSRLRPHLNRIQIPFSIVIDAETRRLPNIG